MEADVTVEVPVDDALVAAVKRTEAFVASCAVPPTPAQRAELDQLILEELLLAGAEAEA